MIENSTSFQNMFLLFIKYVHLITIFSKYRETFIFSGSMTVVCKTVVRRQLCVRQLLEQTIVCRTIMRTNNCV